MTRNRRANEPSQERAPDNPNGSSIIPFNSPGTVLGSQPSNSLGSFPLMQQGFQTPAAGTSRNTGTPVSSLDTITPSPDVPTNNNPNPFVHDYSSPALPADRFTDNSFPSHNSLPSYSFVPGYGFLINRPGIPATYTMGPSPTQENIAIPTEITIDDASEPMTEKERMRRRAEKQPHHGADIGDDDVEDIEIQQAILDNCPIIDDAPESTAVPIAPLKRFLPSETSAQLNTLFNTAVNLVTATLGTGNVSQNQADAIAAETGNEFAANLDAAVAQLMSPRLPDESDSAGNSGTAPVRHSNPGGLIPPEGLVPNITSPETAAQNARYKDRVAIQRMRNSDLRDCGKSNYADQGIAFVCGVPYDRYDPPEGVNPVTDDDFLINRRIVDGRRSDHKEPAPRDEGVDRTSRRPERRGTREDHREDHSQAYDPRGPREEKLVEISETASNERSEPIRDQRRRHGDSSDSDESFSSEDNSSRSTGSYPEDRRRDKRRRARRRRRERDRDMNNRNSGSKPPSDNSSEDDSRSDTESSDSEYSTNSSRSRRSERNRARRWRNREDPEWREARADRRRRRRRRMHDDRLEYQREMKQRILRMIHRSVGHRTDLGLGKSVKLDLPKKFDGKMDASRFEEWLPEVLRYMSLSGLNGPLCDPARLRLLGVCLEGEALIWFNATVEPMYTGSYIPRHRWRFDEAIWQLYHHFVHDQALNNASRDFDHTSWRSAAGMSGVYYDLLRSASRML
ncbi:hypothetical protein C8J56DRAFT_1115956 [Mycena floridula]|nr:hypothetical protein C8J56DRAFT_1115956 [Mycena floridula]